jgi:hypothetical protein
MAVCEQGPFSGWSNTGPSAVKELLALESFVSEDTLQKLASGYSYRVKYWEARTEESCNR